MPSERDIVERLRANTDKYPGFENLNTEAAATIETLRAEVRARRVRDVAFRNGWDRTSAEHLNAVERAVRATDATNALGKESPNV